MPATPRAWINTGGGGDVMRSQPVLFESAVRFASDSQMGGAESLTVTWLPHNEDGDRTPGHIMVTMTRLQASTLIDILSAEVHRMRRNEMVGEQVAQIVNEGLVTEAECAAAAAEVQTRPTFTSDPELERLLQEEEEIERSMRPQPTQMTGPEARPAAPTLAEVQSALRMSGPMRYERTPPSTPRPRYYRDPERTIPVHPRPLP